MVFNHAETFLTVSGSSHEDDPTLVHDQMYYVRYHPMFGIDRVLVEL